MFKIRWRIRQYMYLCVYKILESTIVVILCVIQVVETFVMSSSYFMNYFIFHFFLFSTTVFLHHSRHENSTHGFCEIHCQVTHIWVCQSYPMKFHQSSSCIYVMHKYICIYVTIIFIRWVKWRNRWVNYRKYILFVMREINLLIWENFKQKIWVKILCF